MAKGVGTSTAARLFIAMGSSRFWDRAVLTLWVAIRWTAVRGRVRKRNNSARADTVEGFPARVVSFGSASLVPARRCCRRRRLFLSVRRHPIVRDELVFVATIIRGRSSAFHDIAQRRIFKLRARHSGRREGHGAQVVEGGFEPRKVGVTPVDGQWQRFLRHDWQNAQQ